MTPIEPTAWRRALARVAYGTLMRALLPLLLLKIWWRGRVEPVYRHAIGERFGVAAPDGTGRLWLHAVSLGETRAAAALVGGAARSSVRTCGCC